MFAPYNRRPVSTHTALAEIEAASDSWGRIVRTSEYTHTARDGTDSGYMPQSPAVKTNGLLLSPQAAAIGCRVEPLQAFSQTLAEC